MSAVLTVALGAGSTGISDATGPPGATTYVPITPCRLLDTRPGADNVGNRSTPILGGQIHTVSAHGNNGKCTGIPATATGLNLNVTALNATAATFTTIWPTGATQPFTANLNPTPGQPPTPNAVTTGVSAGGQFDIYNFTGSVDVVVDVFGYYSDHQHTGADIVDGSLTGADVADGSLTGADIQNETVSGADIQNETVSGADIQNETVSGADIQNNTVSNADTSNEPGIASNWAINEVSLTNTAATVISTTLRVPSDGQVKIEVTGDWYNGLIGNSDDAFCQLQKGTTPTVINPNQPYFLLHDRNAPQTGWTAFSGHRVVPVSAADNPAAPGGQTFRLVCVENLGDVRIDNRFISATFYATSY